jgi:hypothetical protein
MENKYELAKKLTDEQFKRMFGMVRETFVEMLRVLNEEYANKHKRRGRHSNLGIEFGAGFIYRQ